MRLNLTPIAFPDVTSENLSLRFPWWKRPPFLYSCQIRMFCWVQSQVWPMNSISISISLSIFEKLNIHHSPPFFLHVPWVSAPSKATARNSARHSRLLRAAPAWTVGLGRRRSAWERNPQTWCFNPQILDNPGHIWTSYESSPANLTLDQKGAASLFFWCGK